MRIISKRKIASTLGILAAAAAAAVGRVSFGQTQVALPYYDPLNYTAGNFAGQGPWSRANTLTGLDNQIDGNVNLNYTQAGNNVLPPSSGNALLLNYLGNPNATEERVLLPTSQNTLYYSLTLRVDALNLVNNSNGVFFANFSDDKATAQGGITGALRIRMDPTDSTKFDLAMDKDGARGSNSTWTGGLAIDGSTMLIVGKYQSDGNITNSNDTASMWINPDSSTFGVAEGSVPSTTFTSTLGTDKARNSFNLGIRGAAADQDPKKYVDDIRIGTSWASVVPNVWKGSTAAYGTAGNWYTATVPNASGIIPSFLDLPTASRTVTLGGNRTIGGMIFNSATGYTIPNDGSTITLDTPDAGALLNGSLGNHTIAAPVVLNTTMSSNVSAGSITISGPVSGAGGVTQDGGAALVLTGSNSYNGATTINGGVIRAADGVGLPTGSNLILTGGAFENTTNTFTRTLGTGAGQVQLPGGTAAGGFSAFGVPVTVTLDSGNTLVWGPTTGGTSFCPGALILNAATANNIVFLTNNIDINGGNRTITVNGALADATAAIISGSITNSQAPGLTNSVTKNGPGLLVLNGANSWNGQTSVAGGVLRGVYGTNIPDIPTSISSILTLSGGVYEPTTATFTQPLGNGTGAGQTRLIGAGASGFSAYGTPLVLNFGGAGAQVLWSNNGSGTPFEPGTLVLNTTTSTASIEFQNPLNLGSAPAQARVIAVNSASFPATISGSISGASASTGLTKTGPGTLFLRSTGNPFVGTLTINQGTLNANDPSLLGSSTATAPLLLTGGGTLQFGATMDLSNNRPIIIGAGGGVIDTNGNSTINGYGGPGIGGGQTAVLTKVGAGTFHTGANNTVGAVGTIIVKQGIFSFVNEGQISGGGVNSAFTLDGGEMRSPTSWNAVGSHPITVTFNNGLIGIDSGQTVSWAGSITGAGVLQKEDGGTFITPNIQGPGIAVYNGKFAFAPNGQAAGVSTVLSTFVSPGAQLDLSDNHLIDHFTGVGTWTGSNYNGMTGMIASGRNGNLWNGSGIITSQSTAAGGNFTTLGVAKASDVRPATATATGIWAGQTITGTDTLVMYTYGGDATLDGKINVDDYIRIDSGIAAHLTGWSNGDFNYDGKVNIDDYTGFIDANIGTQGPQFFASGGAVAGGGASGVSAVPEPVASSLLLFSAAAATLRRRRRRA